MGGAVGKLGFVFFPMGSVEGNKYIFVAPQQTENMAICPDRQDTLAQQTSNKGMFFPIEKGSLLGLGKGTHVFGLDEKFYRLAHRTGGQFQECLG